MPFPLLAIGPIADLAKGIMDKIWPPSADPNLKIQAEKELAIMLEQRETSIIQATQNIIVSEMQQGDSYTKRARPTICYAGLLFIFTVHVVFPVVSWFWKAQMPTISLPEEFWWAWTSVVGIWSLGRTFERRGAQGKLIEAIVGK